MIPVALRELLRAAHWYEGRAPKLGGDLLDEIAKGLAAIRDFPMAHPVVIEPFRRALIERFPYALIFRVDPEQITVVAVANLKRRPRYWLKRAKA